MVAEYTATYDKDWARCPVCRGNKLHPIAQKALATIPMQAAERVRQLEEVAAVASLYVTYMDAMNRRDWVACDSLGTNSHMLYERLRELVLPHPNVALEKGASE